MPIKFYFIPHPRNFYSSRVTSFHRRPSRMVEHSQRHPHTTPYYPILERHFYKSSRIQRRYGVSITVTRTRHARVARYVRGSIIIAASELTSKLVGWQASGNRCKRKLKPDDSCLIGRRETLGWPPPTIDCIIPFEWDMPCFNGFEGFVPREYRARRRHSHRSYPPGPIIRKESRPGSSDGSLWPSIITNIVRRSTIVSHPPGNQAGNKRRR